MTLWIILLKHLEDKIMANDTIEIEIPSLITQVINNIYNDCKEDNWDSYQARAIKKETAEFAKSIFSDIWITPGNDGSITLSFHDECINLEIDENKALNICIMSGKDKHFGITLIKTLNEGDY